MVKRRNRDRRGQRDVQQRAETWVLSTLCQCRTSLVGWVMVSACSATAELSWGLAEVLWYLLENTLKPFLLMDTFAV